MKISMFVFFLVCSRFLCSQDTSDVHRLKNLKYMSLSQNVDCNNTSGSNLDHRICLNLEFQELDSVMNKMFVRILNLLDNDSTRIELQRYQLEWVKHRRLHSQILSEGYQGHMLGVRFLYTMIRITRIRIGELATIEELMVDLQH